MQRQALQKWIFTYRWTCTLSIRSIVHIIWKFNLLFIIIVNTNKSLNIHKRFINISISFPSKKDERVVWFYLFYTHITIEPLHCRSRIVKLYKFEGRKENHYSWLKLTEAALVNGQNYHPLYFMMQETPKVPIKNEHP